MNDPSHDDIVLAAAVQEALLDQHPPDCQAGRVVVKNRMSTSVGGDFHHFRELGQDQVAFAIGDVVGHGLAAALLMSVILGSLRADRLDNRRPSRIAEHINHMLIQLGARVNLPIICSFIYGVVDLPSGLLLYVNAGHPLPIIVNRKSGHTHHLPTTAMVLGVHESSLAEACHQFQPHDRLILYTDGITESRRNDDDPFGPERLRDLLGSLADTPPEPLIEQLFRQFDDFNPDPPQDDQTLVVIDFNMVTEKTA